MEELLKDEAQIQISSRLREFAGHCRHAFSTVSGRANLDYLRDDIYDRLSFDKDPHVTAYNEGQRYVVKLLIENSDPEFEKKLTNVFGEEEDLSFLN